MVGSFLPPIDSSVINVAISYIQNDLGGGPDDVAWVSTAYLAGLAVFVPASNWLANRIGLTRLHRIVMVGFLAGTTMCGLAWDLNSLIFFRVLEALPGSVLPVITITMIYRIVPKDRIGTAMGIYGLGVVVAPGLGPTVGGLLVSEFDWRWVFFFKVPLGALAVIVGLFVLPQLPKDPVRRSFDWLGFLTLGYGLAAIVMVAEKGQRWHWGSYPVLILITTALLSLALFVIIENEVDEPLIDLGIFRRWPFVNSLLMIGTLMLGLYGMSYYLPLFMQQEQHYDAAMTGLLFLPQAMVGMVLVPVVGRMYDRFGGRWLAFVGMSMVALATLLLSGLTVDMTRHEIILWTVIRSVGTGMAFMPIMTNGLNWLPPGLVGYGGAVNNIVQRLTAALGVAVMGVLVSHEGAQLSSDTGAMLSAGTDPGAQHPDARSILAFHEAFQAHVQAAAIRDMFLAATVITAACAALALLLRRSPAAGARSPGGAPRPRTPESTARPATAHTRESSASARTAADRETVGSRGR
jgi:EmrB/QacA subfamily drug resistance transporter